MSGSDNGVAGRTQQTIAASILLLLGLWVAYVSFSVEDPQPYLFPQLIATAMVGLAIFALVRAVRGANRTGSGIPVAQLGRVTPAIALMIVYVFGLIPILGFYAAASLAFITLYSLYDPKPHNQLSSWILRVVVTVGFMTIIYLVFAKGLQVQTPRGLFI